MVYFSFPTNGLTKLIILLSAVAGVVFIFAPLPERATHSHIFLPNISMDSLKEFVKARVEILEGYRLNDFLEGMVHSKLAVYFTEQAKHNGEVLVTKEMEEDVFQLLYQMKHWEFLITGHRGFENAQVTKGGVLLSEVDETLQSVFVPGLYFAGEMLDVDALGMGKRYFDRRKSGKMIRINQLKVIPGTEETLVAYISDTLGIKESDIEEFYIIKKSLDARKKPELFWIYSLDVKVKPSVNIKKLMRNKNVQEAPERNKYVIPECGTEKMTCRPVVVGMGPAGLFCAYLLAQKGFCPVVLEQGNDVDTRLKDVEDFWQGKPLNPNSNVQFGEGGAGTFSDGKLNTGVKDKDGRNREVLEIFVKNGAGEQILYDGKPHIGTDVLGTVVKNMRKEIQKLGGEVFFGHRFEGFETKND